MQFRVDERVCCGHAAGIVMGPFVKYLIITELYLLYLLNKMGKGGCFACGKRKISPLPEIPNGLNHIFFNADYILMWSVLLFIGATVNGRFFSQVAISPNLLPGQRRARNRPLGYRLHTRL